ncbi:hypothetical protein [Escherichia coli]|uniref:hypothetical protein n=1 Tax=Escherichia coli TaxID=562 RepID=UPI002020DEEA|nr:hypothetical protein [Escherichia coli]
MADEDINPVVLLADPKVNHRVWAACLKWSPVVKKQRVPSAYSALFDHGLASKSDQRFASIRSTGNLTFSTAF